MNPASRLRSLAWFLVAAFYYLLAREVAAFAASGLSAGNWFYFADRAILLFLLILGFAAMGYVGQSQRHPIADMGLVRRPGWRREFALGSAIGWAGVATCALMIVIFGGMVVVFYTGWRQFALLPLDLAILLMASLAEEVAFRGYPFQRLIETTSAPAATLLLSLLFAVVHINNPGASVASILVTFFAGWLFAVAYLRTRALWVGWGIHFAWNASMAVLFGLPLSGITQFSPVISSTAIGPTWLTGFDYGPEGSAVAIVVVIALILATIYATRELHYKYAQPIIIPGGIPVDMDAVSRRQHETAMGPSQPAPPQIVQIDGVHQQPQSATETEPPHPPQEV
ncbi:MAG TPA: CPBP family intramembrane glutamic endopeptidase [Silvibacterium sp.]|nr:CPBP family intramembrane glutamic endopeptidase [Silvibacterium sp.]